MLLSSSGEHIVQKPVVTQRHIEQTFTLLDILEKRWCWRHYSLSKSTVPLSVLPVACLLFCICEVDHCVLLYVACSPP